MVTSSSHYSTRFALLFRLLPGDIIQFLKILVARGVPHAGDQRGETQRVEYQRYESKDGNGVVDVSIPTVVLTRNYVMLREQVHDEDYSQDIGYLQRHGNQQVTDSLQHSAIIQHALL